MTEIVLVRHGEPYWEPGGRAVDEPELTPLGHEQARRVAKTLDGERFDAVYVSPLRRARETAAPVLEALGHEPVVQAWLAELRLPTLEGMSGAEVEDYFAHARARDLQHHWEGLPGGESFRHFYERVSSGVESLLAGEHPLGIHENSGYRVWHVPADAPERLLIVAHAGTNAVILSHLLGIEPVPWAYVRFESAWAGISRVRSVPLASGAIWQDFAPGRAAGPVPAGLGKLFGSVGLDLEPQGGLCYRPHHFTRPVRSGFSRVRLEGATLG